MNYPGNLFLFLTEPTRVVLLHPVFPRHISIWGHEKKERITYLITIWEQRWQERERERERSFIYSMYQQWWHMKRLYAGADNTSNLQLTTKKKNKEKEKWTNLETILKWHISHLVLGMSETISAVGSIKAEISSRYKHIFVQRSPWTQDKILGMVTKARTHQQSSTH